MDKRIPIVQLFKSPTDSLIDTTINVKGWVRTKRGNKNVAFIALNDGSIITNLQVVVDLAQFDDDLMR
ncbi:MAG: asparagine--tRNA ligase, partial [Paludibacteraceae bacterium]|nr:asparagine--tRNA ligase [Paludibacteraceae bacterium]